MAHDKRNVQPTKSIYTTNTNYSFREDEDDERIGRGINRWMKRGLKGNYQIELKFDEYRGLKKIK